MDNNKRRDPFIPEYQQPKPRAMEDISPTKKKGESLGSYYWHYFLSRPLMILMAVAMVLEVQPIEELRVSYYVWNRLVNIEEEKLKGVEDEVAHSEGVKSEVLAQIEKAKECQKQREINANTAFVQCNQSGGGAGYCRHLMESAKSVDCPTMPEL